MNVEVNPESPSPLIGICVYAVYPRIHSWSATDRIHTKKFPMTPLGIGPRRNPCNCPLVPHRGAPRDNPYYCWTMTQFPNCWVKSRLFYTGGALQKHTEVFWEKRWMYASFCQVVRNIMMLNPFAPIYVRGNNSINLNDWLCHFQTYLKWRTEFHGLRRSNLAN